MIKSSFRILALCVRPHFSRPAFKHISPMLNNSNIFAFCQSKKHHDHPQGQQSKHKQTQKAENKHDHHNTAESGHHEHGPNCNHQHQNVKQARHQHGPNCNHHHHEAPKHQHGPNCSHHHHNHSHNHEHHAPQVKLSKLTFEELIQLKTEESLKYAHQIYEKEHKRLQELSEQKESLLKSIEFFKKVEEEIKEKQIKLGENIKTVEEETSLSRKRAEKQIEESKTFAVTKIAKQLLEVADCITSCKKFAQQSQVKDKYIEQVIKTQELIRNVLKKFDIVEFDPTNQEFDPNLQQSLVQVPTPPGFKINHVAMTMRTGYTIKGRLLRSARVGVFS